MPALQPLRKLIPIVLAISLTACGGGGGTSGDTGSVDGGVLAPGGAQANPVLALLTVKATADPTPATAEFPAISGLVALPGLDLALPAVRDPSTTYISSPFGPRQKYSDANRYDFHRGVDIPGPSGESLYAIADGTIAKIALEGSADAPEGGNSIYVKHTLPSPISFHGKSVSLYYAVYTHLSGFAAGLSVGQAVAKGEVIGYLGQTGTTTFDHLHFELRLGTTCSLQYQLANPATLCAQNQFDPHVNPMQWLAADDHSAPVLKQASLNDGVLELEVETPANGADFNAIAVVLKDSQGAPVYQHVADLNGRSGFDASSVATLDDSRQGSTTYAPGAFQSGAVVYAMRFSHDLNALAQVPVSGRVLVQDIWGNSATWSLSFE